jgi:hypothetical protein
VSLSDSGPTVKIVVTPFSADDSLDEQDLNSVFSNFGPILSIEIDHAHPGIA